MKLRIIWHIRPFFLPRSRGEILLRVICSYRYFWTARQPIHHQGSRRLTSRGIVMEIPITPTPGNAPLTSPHHHRKTRVISLNITIRRLRRKILHLRRTRQAIQILHKMATRDNTIFLDHLVLLILRNQTDTLCPTKNNATPQLAILPIVLIFCTVVTGHCRFIGLHNGDHLMRLQMPCSIRRNTTAHHGTCQQYRATGLDGPLRGAGK